MNKTIIFYGHLPKEGQLPIGGGEVGNYRTLKMLRSAGYTVKVIRMQKPSLKWGAKVIHAMYPLRLLSVLVRFILCLLFTSRNAIVHVSGFAGVNVWSECALVSLAKRLGFFTIYEQRAGGAIMYYEGGSEKYKKAYASILRKADYIFTQGMENIPMMKSISDNPIYHYPNCVEDSFAPSEMPIKNNEIINLLYFGRIENTKHPDLIVDAASIVQKKYPNTHLTIIGGGYEPEIEKTKTLMASSLQKGTYNYMPGLPHEKLAEYLKDCRFYIFPSTQPREGQSNSVTECMSYGIIPIASPQGFNRSTIGNDYLIVDGLVAEEYAKKVLEIVDSGKEKELSKQMYARFNTFYRQSVVFEQTLKVYESIFTDISKRGKI